MRILLTGGSSFTGLWFARALTARGHAVVATLTRARTAYEGTRAERVALLADVAELRENVAFGDEAFLAMLREEPWDAIGHHGAQVGDYRSDHFPLIEATASNTRNLSQVLETSVPVVLTGSVFEFDEGAGEDDRVAFSPYGVSKGLTHQVFREACRRAGVKLGKFVIPNPFGPNEELRFTSFMVRSWLRGEDPAVRTPDYLRDNIHVDLLALAYADFVERTVHTDAMHTRANPSGYVETQGAFAQRFADAMRTRGIPAPETVPCLENAPHPEPMRRHNTEPAVERHPEWNESAAWDALAAWYLTVFASESR